MILLLHHRYREVGGEERAVADLQWLIREHLDEDAEVLERDSGAIGQRDAALGLLRGGLRPEEVADAVRRTGARVLHAHNVNPTFGWRALAAAKAAGARVVLHLHNYRLVCAVATCFTRGADCTRCHGRNTLPGVRLNCRGGSRAESAAYAASLSLWQQRITGAADEIVVPSAFALDRLRDLGAPLGGKARVLGSVQRDFAAASHAAAGEFVLAAGRLTPEKGFADVLEACGRAGLPLVIAGDGAQRAELEARAAAEGRLAPAGELAGRPARGPRVEFVGHVSPSELADLRRRAAVAVVPSRYAEILPLAALEAMAAGLPTVAAASGGLTEAVPEEGLYPPGAVEALQGRLTALFGDAQAGERALRAARARSAPEVIAKQLAEVYGATSGSALY
ncbi:glycosyltransferase involved in cell wall biosynthesis [Solirubrobacter pauli]|uniref:Glycosyltransferase involved in cell wall biosynthesis n=1 Tax=Solirubrobacter pauli TaxID=166793 RepID=A0A660LG06_9ACTN|nr:glycosyltransferase family 4 protein [Solirubrobacter pauli]RKQ92850.1 glycosyltransferase involved in cell wall biosynthesis [Solirubrobacter pauli]